MRNKQGYSVESSLKKLKVDFPKPKQARSQTALANLIQAAEKIVYAGDVKGFNARFLTEISGHSLGSLVQRLGKVENIFLHAIAHQRSREFITIASEFDEFPDSGTVTDFAEKLVSVSISRIQGIGPIVIRYYESRAMGRTNNVRDIHAYTDECIPLLQKVLDKNKSNTFGEFSPFEMRYLLRSLFLVLERPFVEGDEDAGSEKHRLMAVKFISSLLSKSCPPPTRASIDL